MQDKPAGKATSNTTGDAGSTGTAAAGAMDGAAFGQNMLRAYEALGDVIAALAENRQQENDNRLIAEEVNQAAKSLFAVWSYWVSEPERAQTAQSALMEQLGRTMLTPYAPDGTARNGARSTDRRFVSSDWDEQPAFTFMRDFYLTMSDWAEMLVEKADDLDPHTRQKAEFYMRQVIAALAPTNFPLTNPEVIRETFSSGGENVARGMEMLAEDIAAGKGQLRIRQTDTSSFVLGENIAATPGKVIAQNDLCQLIQYQATTDKVLKRPLLIVPPWINKYYILDLNPQKSFIKWAVDQGHTVFVISWVNPTRHLAGKGFDDYMSEGIIHSLDIVEAVTAQNRINIIGYCVGGTLLAATLAYMAQTGDTRAATATFLTTQVDFTHGGDLKVFIDDEQLAVIEAAMDEKGYFDGASMAHVFNMLRPQDLIWPYVVSNYLKGKEPVPFDLLAWNADSTRMTVANHGFYLRQCYKENALARGCMKLKGETLKLSKVTVPIYALAAREDHIVPAKSAFLSAQAFARKGANVRFVLAGSGHIAGVINPPCKTKYQYWSGGKVAGNLDNWIEKAHEHPGSWWTDWHIWMLKQDNAQVRPRKPGNRKYRPIEDAPGSYVRVKL